MKNFGKGPYIILEVSFKSELNYKLHEKLQRVKISIITPPARRAWRSYKFASLDFSGFFFGVRSWAAAHG